jgi:integrase
MLTDAKIKAAKATDRDYKLGDSGQLYLLVTKAGGKLWRMNYTFGRTAKGTPAQKTLALGSYPVLTLVEARAERDSAKATLRAGRDPAAARRTEARARAISDENTFELVALRWFELKSGWSVEKFKAWRDVRDGKWSLRDAGNWIERPEAGWSVVHAGDVFRSLERDVFPEIGAEPIATIDSPMVYDVLNGIVARGAIETAHRICQRISDVYIYAIPAGLAKNNPAASMSKALPTVPRSKKQPSIVDRLRDHDAQVAAVRKLLKDCDAERCRATTKFAQRLIALTSVRPNEIQNAEWSELEDLDGPEPLWRIPAERMKGDQDRKAEDEGDHLVPLSTQALEVIRALRLLTGNYQLMFPSERHAHLPMSENTLRQHLMRAGYYKKHVPHGWRAAMSTIMNEHPDRREGDRAVIDLMLAHVPTNKVEGAYNRAEYMPRRREIAQTWADLITLDLEPPEAQIGRPVRWAATGPGAPAP